ncbi:hypothetical protein VNO77_03302 [Canavalia gladiata]|uniref:Uncharacterized protein n=1 Tax=Canavalia gladiata TaxID=3824 RepID=A0AAN9N048_CANGL
MGNCRSTLLFDESTGPEDLESTCHRPYGAAKKVCRGAHWVNWLGVIVHGTLPTLFDPFFAGPAGRVCDLTMWGNTVTHGAMSLSWSQGTYETSLYDGWYQPNLLDALYDCWPTIIYLGESHSGFKRLLREKDFTELFKRCCFFLAFRMCYLINLYGMEEPNPEAPLPLFSCYRPFDPFSLSIYRRDPPIGIILLMIAHYLVATRLKSRESLRGGIS